MAIHQLINLDFTPGIKAEYINQNFELIKKWITNERLRIGGWGIVEGFDMTCDNSTFTVNVGEGILINQDGEEVEVPKYVYGAGPLQYNIISKEYLVDSDGKIMLNDFCYDPNNHKYITYNPPTLLYDIDPKYLYITDPDGFYVPISRVLGKNIWVDETQNKGKRLTVTQCVALDRIDSVMLHPDGTYEYLWSIDSPNPSHVDLGDYENSFCVGVIYWTVDTNGVQSEIFTNHRSYRKIYVDKTNTLYINGEVYKKSKFIYFEEPDETIRELNDLWYDEKSNTLYIWRYRDGELGWVIVNDHSEIIVKERKVWYPDENPGDLKTFRFEDDEVNLYFVPGSNALSVSIDCATLMDDMYEELIIDNDRVSSLREALEQKKIELEEKEQLLKTFASKREEIETLVRGLKKDLAQAIELYSDILNTNNIETVHSGVRTGIAKLDKLNEGLENSARDIEEIAIKYSTVQKSISILENEIDVLDSIVNGTYVSNGYGFRLKRPLTHAAYVEVTVTHIVRMKPVRETFQRAAIFVREGDITVVDPEDKLFETSAVYAVGNDQIEVYIDGIRLSKAQRQFYEVVDRLTQEEEETLGTNYVNFKYGDNEHKEKYLDRSSQHFRINRELKAGQIVSYRISKHVWSYDQLDALLKNIEEYARGAYENAIDAVNKVNTLNEYVTEKVNEIYEKITQINETLKILDKCYKYGDAIPLEALPAEIKDNVIGMPIDRYVSAATPNITLEGIKIKKDKDGVIVGGDIFQVYYMSKDENRILVRKGIGRAEDEYDYTLNSSNDGKSTIMRIVDDLIDSSAHLYIVGFKRGLEEAQ